MSMMVNSTVLAMGVITVFQVLLSQNLLQGAFPKGVEIRES